MAAHRLFSLCTLLLLGFTAGCGKKPTGSGAPAPSAGAPPAVAAELRAADRALDGIRARATMFLHESSRTERWALALLSPEGEAAQEEAPRAAPETIDDH